MPNQFLLFLKYGIQNGIMYEVAKSRDLRWINSLQNPALPNQMWQRRGSPSSTKGRVSEHELIKEGGSGVVQDGWNIRHAAENDRASRAIDNKRRPLDLQ